MDIQWSWLLTGAGVFWFFQILLRSWWRHRQFIAEFGVSQKQLSPQDAKKELDRRWNSLVKTEKDFQEYRENYDDPDMIAAYENDIAKAEEGLIRVLFLADRAGCFGWFRRFVRHNHNRQRKRSSAPRVHA